MLATFYTSFVDTTARVATVELGPDEAQRLAIQAAAAQVDGIVERSWVDAQRRVLDTAFVVRVLIFAASTFLRGQRPTAAGSARHIDETAG